MTHEIQGSAKQTEFPTGAVRHDSEGKGRYDLLPVLATRRIAAHWERGGKTFGDRNWEKGQPVGRLLDSAKRHIDQWLAGETDEDHLAAVVWNVMATMEFEERQKLGMARYAALFDGLGPLWEFNRRKKLSEASPPSQTAINPTQTAINPTPFKYSAGGTYHG